MNHDRAAELTRILRSYNPALAVQAFPSTSGEGRAWWATYTVPSLGPIRLFTLDALDPDASGWRHPGPWIVDALKALRWQRLVAQAKQVFALTQDEYKRKTKLDTARAA